VVDLPLLSIPAAFVMIHGAILSALFRWRQDASQVWARHDLPLPVVPATVPEVAAAGAASGQS
jgi:hypothetical protein